MTAGAELQSLQSNDAALTLAAPALTTTANGTIETLTSPSFFATPFNVVSRAFAAFLSSVILLFEAMDPVTSSASASSSFLTPHTISFVTLRLICSWPMILVNVVGTAPVAPSVSL